MRLRSLLSKAILAGIFLVASFSDTAGQFVVDTTDDTTDLTPGDGVCADASGSCSLRASVMEANATPGDNDVFVPEGEYLFTLGTPGENGAVTGDLDILDNLSIVGENTRTTIIRADSLDRVFHVLPGVIAQIEQVEIHEGYVLAADGGGLLNEGELTLSEVTVWSSMAEGDGSGQQGGGFGGAICNRGTLLLEEVTISFCHALGGKGSNGVAPGGGSGGGAGPGLGGAIYNDIGATATLINATISNNTAQGGRGGNGTFHQGSGTVSSPGGAGGGFGGNAGGTGAAGGAGAWGGGGGGGGSISGAGANGGFGGGGGGGGASSWGGAAGPGGTAGNFGGNGGQGCCSGGSGGGGGAGLGGGIFDRSGNCTLTNCTLAFNQAVGGNGGGGWFSGGGGAGSGVGGAIFNLDGTVSTDNCLFAENSASTSGVSLAGNIGSDQGHNLVQLTDAEVAFVGTTTGDLLDVDPIIYPLANNGGNTDTHLLEGCDPVSPAIDAGNDALAPAEDQIGQARINISDIGALEVPSAVAELLPADTTLCFGETLLLDMTTDGATYLWNDDSVEPTLLVESAGTYSVTLTVNNCDFFDEVEVDVNPLTAVDLGPDQSICPGEVILLETNVDGESYEWQDASSLPTLTVDQEGTYSVTVFSGDCSVSDEVVINPVAPVELDLGPDVSICEGEEIELGTDVLAEVYDWSSGGDDAVITVGEAGDFTLVIEVEGCTYSDDVSVELFDTPVVDLGADLEICLGESALLDASGVSGTYAWQDGSTASSLEVFQSGTYEVIVTENGCSGSDEVEVTALPIPVFELGPDQIVCYNEGFELEVVTAEPGVGVLWNTGAPTATISPDTTGLYAATTLLGDCFYTDEVYVEVIPEFTLDLGADLRLCEGIPVFLYGDIGSFSYPVSYAWSEESVEAELLVEESGSYWLEVTSDCESLTDEVSIEFEACDCRIFVPNAFTPNDDGNNDVFEVVSTCDMISYVFRVFNRNGEVLFESEDPVDFWNGSVNNGSHYAPDGVYAWRLEYEYVDISGAKSENLFGHVTVVR